LRIRTNDTTIDYYCNTLDSKILAVRIGEQGLQPGKGVINANMA
jgi:hypothetical protein